jgi:sulfite oxidase
MSDLQARFSRSSVEATISCAGNRRAQLSRVRPIADEIPWGDAAIGTARWTGAPLGEVLAAAGPAAEARHVELTGLDDAVEDAESGRFAGSIPLDKALGSETLLAYEMNGEPLPRLHGFPLRAVVPGYVGARSVKWLSAITLTSEPSATFYQARSYRLFPPHVSRADVRWEEGLALGELAVNAAICRPRDGEAVPAGGLVVAGWAIGGGARSVARVDVSADGGATWTPAELRRGDTPWAWCLWSAKLELKPGRHELVARAFDSSANAQPESAAGIWNFKGYANNACPQVRVVAE